LVELGRVVVKKVGALVDSYLFSLVTTENTMDKIFYHHVKKDVPCPDGIVSAWVAQKYYDDAQLFGCIYQMPKEDLPPVEQGDRLIIVDFSFPQQIIKEWLNKASEIIVLDHHKTAMENRLGIGGKLVEKFDMTKCGAILTWEYFFPDKPIPPFLWHIQDRDLWQFKLPMTNKVHAVMGRIGRTFQMLDLYEGLNYEREFLVLMEQLGGKLLKEKEEKIAKILERKKCGEVAGYPSIFHLKLASEEEPLTSDLCSALYKQHPESLFVACLMSDHLTWSLRSDRNGSNTDVSQIAKQFGGGGHRNAAGFKLESNE
jgi:oligoribonuclease NrnB/cAMP/cGMP phosphodiesterase (DHH superfamily)